MKLSEGRIGKSYKILNFEKLAGSTERRLESLGMTPGTTVDILNNKSYGTIILRLRESRYAIGRTITRHVSVEETEGPSLLPLKTSAHLSQKLASRARESADKREGKAHG